MSSISCFILLDSEKMPRIDSEVKLDFKDVLFRPKRSTLKSRSEVKTYVIYVIDVNICRCISSMMAKSAIFKLSFTKKTRNKVAKHSTK